MNLCCVQGLMRFKCVYDLLLNDNLGHSKKMLIVRSFCTMLVLCAFSLTP